ncbi:hypothetical protein CCG21_004618 [Salmonella enterica]|nr:hypothetical protein [Salmonella enterica]
MFFHMITLFLFLSLLILLIRIFSARLIIPAVGVFLPVSSLWMGFHMLTQNESCLDNIACWICPYISRHLLSLNPLQARCRRYSRGER